MNTSQHASISQTMAAIRHYYQARSAQSNVGPYSPYSPYSPYTGQPIVTPPGVSKKRHHQYTKDGIKIDIPVGMMGIQYDHIDIPDDVNGGPNDLKSAFQTIYTGEPYPNIPNNTDISLNQACNRLHSYGANFDERNIWGLTENDFEIKKLTRKETIEANRPKRNAIAWKNFVQAVSDTNAAIGGGNLQCLISRQLAGLHVGRSWTIAEISDYVGALIDMIFDANLQGTVAGWYLGDDTIYKRNEEKELFYSLDQWTAVVNAVQAVQRQKTVQRDTEVNWPFYWADPMDLGVYWTSSRTADDVPNWTFKVSKRFTDWIDAIPKDAYAVFMPYYYAWTAGSWNYGHNPPWRLWTKLMEGLDAQLPASKYPNLKFHPILDASKKLLILNSDDGEDGIDETIRVLSNVEPPGHADMHKQVRVLWNILEKSRLRQPHRIEGIWFLGWNIDTGVAPQKAIAHDNWTSGRKWARAIQGEPHATEEIKAAIPGANAIFPNFPNPFFSMETEKKECKGGTRIPYHLAERASFRIDIHTAPADGEEGLGFLDRTITEGYTGTSPQGKFANANKTPLSGAPELNKLGGTSAFWDGTNDKGRHVDTGTYHAYLYVDSARVNSEPIVMLKVDPPAKCLA